MRYCKNKLSLVKCTLGSRKITSWLNLNSSDNHTILLYFYNFRRYILAPTVPQVVDVNVGFPGIPTNKGKNNDEGAASIKS